MQYLKNLFCVSGQGRGPCTMEPMCRSENNFQESLLSLTMLVLQSNSAQQVEEQDSLPAEPS